MILFTQKKTDDVEAFEKTFNSFEDIRLWVAKDKTEEYGDVLSFGGTFSGLSEEEVSELNEMTYEDAIKLSETLVK